MNKENEGLTMNLNALQRYLNFGEQTNFSAEKEYFSSLFEAFSLHASVFGT